MNFFLDSDRESLFLILIGNVRLPALQASRQAANFLLSACYVRRQDR